MQTETEKLMGDDQPSYQFHEVFVYVLTSNLGVRGVFRTKEKAQKKLQHLQASMIDNPRTYEITRTFFELVQVEAEK